MTQPVLYIFVGYPGAGKTTVARLIAEHSDAVHLWADLERHTMFTTPTHSHQESRELYAHLNKVVDDMLGKGQSVIFDTNFNYRKDRDHLRSIAAKRQAKVVTIWLTTPMDLARRRATLESDGKTTRIWGNMATDAFDRMSDQLQPPGEDEHAIQLDGTNLDIAQAKQLLGLTS